MSTTLKPRFAFALPAPFAQVEQEMDHLMGRFFGDGNGQREWTFSAPANLWEDEGKWMAEIELPGVKQEDLEITLDKGLLRVVARRPAPEGQRKYRLHERGYGRIERLFHLSETVDPEGIEAELQDGVLTLTLAKRPEAQPRKIEVKSAATN